MKLQKYINTVGSKTILGHFIASKILLNNTQGLYLNLSHRGLILNLEACCLKTLFGKRKTIWRLNLRKAII